MKRTNKFLIGLTMWESGLRISDAHGVVPFLVGGSIGAVGVVMFLIALEPLDRTK